jgi:hypothetical protein
MKYLAALLILGLFVAHQDYWQWNRKELVFGFLPHTIAWHGGLCVMTSLVWVWITATCWPRSLDALDVEDPGPVVHGNDGKNGMKEEAGFGSLKRAPESGQ